MHHPRRNLGLTAIAIGSILASAAPAHAATPRSPLRMAVLEAGHWSDVAATSAVGTSTSNAGYLGSLTGSDTFTTDVIVPTVDCSSAPQSPLFIDVFLNGQDASGNFSGSGGVVFIQCSGSTPTYTAQVSVDFQTVESIPVSPGDTVLVQGKSSLSGEQYRVRDNTSGQSITGSGPGLAGDDLQLTTQGGFSTDGGFPPFTRYGYTSIKVDGTSFANHAPDGFSQVDANNSVMIQTSGLNKAGTAFALSYVANS